jgi:hypothetical protein
MIRIRIVLVLATALLALAWCRPWQPVPPKSGALPTTAPPPATPAVAGGHVPALAPAPLAEPARMAPAPTALPADGAALRGLRGRTVSADGRARPGVQLAVLLAPAWSPMARARLHERGEAPTPVGAGQSGPDGRFELAVPPAAIGVPFELWAAADGDADTMSRHAGLGADEWRELGDLRLAAAFPVTGRVVDDAGQPVAGATVDVWPADAEPGGTPSLCERRIVADGEGRFRVGHLGKGMYCFAADAPGHARCELDRQHVFDDQPNEILLTLRPGGAVDGVVVDRDGAPIAGARIAGEADDPANLARPSARSGPDGRFALAGLDRGAWTLRACAPDHQTTAVRQVAAGMRGLRIVLPPQAGVRLRVTGAGGEALRRYVVTARPPRHQPGAALQAMPPMHIGPDDVRDGASLLRGFDAGAWQLEVSAPDHALTFSDAFELRVGEIVDVAVAMANGGAIVGSAFDDAGKPLAGAAVQTQPDGFGDGELGVVFRGLQIWSVSAAENTVGADGRFALRHLAPGEYQLRVGPAGGMPSYVRGLVVRDGESTVVPPLRLARGCAFAGTVQHDDGDAAAGVYVQVQAIDVPDLPSGHVVEAAADAQGRFLLPLRLRPGRYAAMAGRRLADNPFQEDADREASRQEFAVDAARSALDLTLRIPR